MSIAFIIYFNKDIIKNNLKKLSQLILIFLFILGQFIKIKID